MAETPPHPESEDTESAELYGVSGDRVAALRAALEAGETAECDELASGLHSADLADLIEALTPPERSLLLDIIGHRIDPEVLTFLDDRVRDEVYEKIGPKGVAAAIRELDTDDALELVEGLEEPVREEVLGRIEARDRAALEQALGWPEESAGRLMQREFVAAPAFWTVGDTIDYLRDAAERGGEDLPTEFFDIFVVDPSHRPLGAVSLSRLLRTRRPVPLDELMRTDLHPIPVTTDQEEVANLFRQYDLASAPVVDDAGRLVGVVTYDDVMDVIHEEAEEDIMRLGGVQEGDLYHAALSTTRSRFSWLAVNLVTAIVASVVIGLFEATIQQVVALAVLMPIVASMGGNAGTQTLTVAVRALAVHELTPGNALRVVGKEALVGGINGLLFAVVMGLVAWLWFGDPAIGGVIAAAMVINLLVAGLAGAVIPIALDRVGIDPAVASSVFLTTITDVIGFLAFLGLAALVLF